MKLILSQTKDTTTICDLHVFTKLENQEFSLTIEKLWTAILNDTRRLCYCNQMNFTNFKKQASSIFNRLYIEYSIYRIACETRVI